MTDIEKPEDHSPSRPAGKRVALALVPILFLALTYLALRKGSVALSHDSKPILSEDESRRLTEVSKSATAQGRYNDALTSTLTLYKAYPANQIYIERLATIYGHLGRYDEESRYWEKYMDHAPTPVGACPQYGQSLWKQGEKFEPQAIAAYQRCLALEPTNTDSIFYLGHALEMSSQWSKAADEYQKGVAISPGYEDLTLGLARCWLRMDRPIEARKLLIPLLNKPSVSSGAMLAMGMYYLHQENYGMAKKILTSGAELARTDPDFPVLLARVAEQTDDKVEELRQYTRVVALKPGDQLARARQNTLLAALSPGK
jgi:tetratricopeptide (TPR) repeat protein